MLDEKWIKSSIEDMEYENLILFIDLVNARAMGLKDLSWNIENEDYRFGMFLKYHYRESFINSYFNTCKDAGSIRGLFSVSGTAKAILKPFKPFTSLDGPSICQQ